MKAGPLAGRRGSLKVEDIVGLLSQYKEAIVAGASAVVALFGAVLSGRETRKQRTILKETLRQRLDEASLEWGDEAIDALSAAEGLAAFTKTTTFGSDRLRVSQQLSALADRGRMFFPNIDERGKGDEKESAFRGSRPPILQAMIFAHLELKSVEAPHQGNAAFINRCRRLVVSELQAHLDPRQRDEIVGRYTKLRRQHQEDAVRRASALQAELESARPYLFKDEDAR